VTTRSTAGRSNGTETPGARAKWLIEGALRRRVFDHFRYHERALCPTTTTFLDPDESSAAQATRST